MDHQMQTIFAPLKATLEARTFDFPDLLDIIAGFIHMDPNIAAGITNHARDILVEDPTSTSLSPVIAEVYRRTFFDRAHAEKYGTQAMLDHGPEMMQDFVNHLCGSFAMDDMQAASGSFHEPARGQ